MPVANSRYMKSDIELCSVVARALGYRAKRTNVKPHKDKSSRYEFEVKTLWGTTTVRVSKDDPKAAIDEAAPAFHERHESEMLSWIGRKSVHLDFEFSLRVIQKEGAQWAVVIKTGNTKQIFKRPVDGFPASRPIAEAVAYVYKELMHGD